MAEFRYRREVVALDGGTLALSTISPDHEDTLGRVELAFGGGAARVYTYLSRSALDELVSAAILVRMALDEDPEPGPLLVREDDGETSCSCGAGPFATGITPRGDSVYLVADGSWHETCPGCDRELQAIAL